MLGLGTLSAASVRAEAAGCAVEIVAAHCANHYKCDARAREARRVNSRVEAAEANACQSRRLAELRV